MPEASSSSFSLPHGFRRGLAFVAFFAQVNLVVPRPVRGEEHVAVKWQDYQEDDGRIRVLSKYLGVEKKVTESVSLRLHAVHDAISGSTPTGSTGASGDDVVLAELTDVRDAGVVDLDWTRGIHKTSFQYAHSKESDFLSRGYAVYNTSEYNKRNTGISYGVSYIDDEIQPAFFSEERKKESLDGFIGISQVVDPNTTVKLNLSLSRFEGYLNDPYKVIRKGIEIFPGFFIRQDFGENRPDERNRRIAFLEVKRFIPKVKGGLDFDYRYFDDDWGIESHTFDLEWYQKIGDKLTLRPSYRIYNQNQADFYYVDLDGTDIMPVESTVSSAPYFSADHRLAKLSTETLGLKAVFHVREGLDFDVSWERYEMKGEGPDTLAEAFPSADILTIGGAWWF